MKSSESKVAHRKQVPVMRTETAGIRTIELVNGNEVAVCGQGVVHLSALDSDGKKVKLKLSSVLYVPDLEMNLVSVGQLVDKGVSVKFEGSVCTLEIEGESVGVADRTGNLFKLRMDQERLLEVRATMDGNLKKDPVGKVQKRRSSQEGIDGKVDGSLKEKAVAYSARSSGIFEEENFMHHGVDGAEIANPIKAAGKVQQKEEEVVSSTFKGNKSLLNLAQGKGGFQVKANVPWRKNWSFDSRGSLQKQQDRNKDSGGISEVPVQPENPTKPDWNLNSGGISQVPVQPTNQLKLDDGDMEVLLKDLISRISEVISIQTEKKLNEHLNDWHRGGMLNGTMQIISDTTELNESNDIEFLTPCVNTK
jgi:hypothetical protein